MNTEKIALVGCGHIAHVHMRYLTRIDKTVSVVCDSSEIRVREFADRYHIEHYETSLDEMLKNHKPQVVHVLVPPHLHYDIVKKCLERDCHVLVEKPCCEKAGEHTELAQLASTKGLVFTVDHTRVFNPMLTKARSKLESGHYGEVVRMEYAYDDPSIEIHRDRQFPVSYRKTAPAWFQKLRGGVVTDLIPHPLSVMLSIDQDLELHSTDARVSDGVIEGLIACLKSETTDCLITMSMNSQPLKNELRIYCEKGCINIDFRNMYYTCLPHRSLPNIVVRVVDTLSSTLQIQFRFLASILLLLLGRRHPYDGLDTLMEQFYGKIGSGSTGPIELINAGKVTRLSEQIIDSAIKPGEAVSDIDSRISDSLQQRPNSIADILVTGATGFIGSYLVDELIKREQNVKVLARSPRSASRLPGTVNVHLGDIKDPAVIGTALKQTQTVFHCAAAMHGDWAEFYSNTVDGTKNLLSSLEKSNVKNFIYISSLGVIDYKRLRNGSTLTEDSPVESQPSRRGSYTKAKKEAEDLVWKFKEQHPEISVTIVRPGLVYGRESNTILNNAGILLGNKLVCFGLGGRYLGLVHVANLAKILASLGLNEIEGSTEGPIHIVDKEQPTVRQYVRMFKSKQAGKLLVLYIPVIFWRLLFKFADMVLGIVRKKNPDFSYRFNSNAKTLHYRSMHLEKHPPPDHLLHLTEAVEDALSANQ